VPKNSKAVRDYVPNKGKKFRELAAANGDGWKLPPPPASFLAVNALTPTMHDATIVHF
jgi:hypothetical protein